PHGGIPATRFTSSTCPTASTRARSSARASGSSRVLSSPAEVSIPTLQIRPADAADAGVIASLLTHLGYPAEPDDIPPRLTALDDSANIVLVASEGGSKPLGLVAVHALPALHAMSSVALIMALVVAPEARGR